jgi:predicted 2-oxoglutarate/Fe(II)-dependent dioxygenase YbiX
MLDHPMEVGDAVCFVSHKFHNVLPVTRGTRRSMVIELWQGGNSGYTGR